LNVAMAGFTQSSGVHEEQADGFLMRSARLGLYFSDGNALTAGARTSRHEFVFAFARTVAQALK
jgi:hypothetical protein